MSAAINGWAIADLAPYVDDHGIMGADGARAAYMVIAGCPAGANVRLHIGAARAVGEILIANLIEGGIFRAAKVEVTGSDPRGIEELTKVLRHYRDVA